MKKEVIRTIWIPRVLNTIRNIYWKDWVQWSRANREPTPGEKLFADLMTQIIDSMDEKSEKR